MRVIFLWVVVVWSVSFGASAADEAYLSEDEVNLERLQDELPPTKGVGASGHARRPLPKISILLRFASNSTALSEKGMKVIAVLKEAMDDIWLQYDFVIEGHSDPIGSFRANEKLSLARAAKVRELLIGQGISESRLRAVGKGEREPVSAKDPHDPRNRRVVLQAKFPEQ